MASEATDQLIENRPKDVTTPEKQHPKPVDQSARILSGDIRDKLKAQQNPDEILVSLAGENPPINHAAKETDSTRESTPADEITRPRIKDPWAKQLTESDDEWINRLERLANEKNDQRAKARQEQLEEDKKNYERWKQDKNSASVPVENSQHSEVTSTTIPENASSQESPPDISEAAAAAQFASKFAVFADKFRKLGWKNTSAYAATIASIAAPVVFNRLGIQQPVVEAALAAVASGFAGHDYAPVSTLVAKHEENTMENTLAAFYQGKADTKALAQVLARDPYTSAETLLAAPQQHDEDAPYIPESSNLLFQALITHQKEQGIPEIIARKSAIEKYETLQQEAQKIREATMTHMKDAATKAADVGVGVLAGLATARIGAEAASQANQPMLSGMLNGADDMANIGARVAKSAITKE